MNGRVVIYILIFRRGFDVIGRFLERFFEGDELRVRNKRVLLG